MYLKLKPDDRAKVQYVLQMLAREMWIKLREYSDKRKTAKNIDKHGG